MRYRESSGGSSLLLATSAVLALLFILVGAVPAGAVPSASSEAGLDAATRSYPDLVLRGSTVKRIPWTKLPRSVVWDGAKAGDINPTLRAVYRGQTLYKLIGLVDGGTPGFNVARARRGYAIQFICKDGYKVKISSKTIIGKRSWIIAKLKNGSPLPAGEGPYRYVGSFIKPFNGTLSARMIVSIKLIF